MKTIIYILLILFILTFVFLCVMWSLSHASGHNIPDKTDIEAYRLMILNVLVIGILLFTVRKIAKKS
jgi:membrane carboxypeptidase/penicillin-binding protein